MAESVAGFRDSLKKPPVKEEGEILVATADGKGIPMRRPADQPPVGARRKKGEKANKKESLLRRIRGLISERKP